MILVIPGFPQVGGTELVIVLVVLLLFFGASRIPELGRSLGKSMLELRKGASEGHDDDGVEASKPAEASQRSAREGAVPSGARSQVGEQPPKVG